MTSEADRVAAVDAAMRRNDAPAAVAIVRADVRALVSALAAALPPVEDDAATWSDLTEAHAVRGYLAAALRATLATDG